MSAIVEIDPLLKLQLEELNRFLDKIEGVAESKPEKLVSLAEHICEWTRTVLSHSFGRISSCDAAGLRACFNRASLVIENFAKVSSISAEDRETLNVYAEHVGSRVTYLPAERPLQAECP